MSTVLIDPDYVTQLAALDSSMRELNSQKIKLIFEAIGITIKNVDFKKLLD